MLGKSSNQNSSKNPIKTLKEFSLTCVLYLEKQILEFARDSHRPPEELKKPILYRYGLEIAIGISIFIFFVTTFGPTIMFQIGRWSSYEATIPLDSSRWSVLLETNDSCGETLGQSCPGNPENETLWKSQRHLSDDNHQSVVKDLRGKKFWIGLELSTEEVKKAYEAKAPVLEIGIFNSGYRTFVNGILADQGSGRDFLPANVQLPLSLLKDGKPVRVSVEIDHNLGSRIPVWMPQRMGGMFSYDAAKAHSGFWNFFLSFRKLFLGSWSVLIAFIFIMLWISVPKKAEYFFFSLYMFVFSLIQFIGFGPLAYGIQRSKFYPADYWLVATEGVLGCLLGASYARVRKVYLFWVLGIGALVSFSGYLTAADHIELYLFKDVLMKFYTPVMFAIGSLFCFAQSYFLGRQSNVFVFQRTRNLRKNRLLAFGFLLTTFGAIFYSQNYLPLATSPEYLFRTIQLAFMALIGGILFSEFRDREKQFEISQRSPFHDPFGGSAEEISGFLVSLDLKKSSLLANFTAQNKFEKRPLTVWNILIGQILTRHNGYKISDEGDGFKIFFPSENSENGLKLVIDGLIEAANETKALESRMREAQVLPKDFSLDFRAGVVWGAVNPIWKDFVGVKTAEFEDAKGTTTFKNAHRLMDYEKELNFENQTIVIYAGQFANGSIFSNYQSQFFEADIRDVGPTNLAAIIVNSANSDKLAA